MTIIWDKTVIHSNTDTKRIPQTDNSDTVLTKFGQLLLDKLKNI